MVQRENEALLLTRITVSSRMHLKLRVTCKAALLYLGKAVGTWSTMQHNLFLYSVLHTDDHKTFYAKWQSRKIIL